MRLPLGRGGCVQSGRVATDGCFCFAGGMRFAILRLNLVRLGYFRFVASSRSCFAFGRLARTRSDTVKAPGLLKPGNAFKCILSMRLILTASNKDELPAHKCPRFVSSRPVFDAAGI